MTDRPLQFTMTACRRPDVLHFTLQTLAATMRGVDFDRSTLFLNADPLPDANHIERMVGLCGNLFHNLVINAPGQPNFAAAVKWCWSRPSDEFFFHLEDDWEFIEPFNVNALIEQMRKDQMLASCTLRAYVSKPTDSRILLSPGLFRTEHAKIIASRLNTDANPEKQLRTKTSANPHGGKDKGFRGTVWMAKTPSKIFVRDHGRAWMQRNGLRKRGNDFEFVTWERAA